MTFIFPDELPVFKISGRAFPIALTANAAIGVAHDVTIPVVQHRKLIAAFRGENEIKLFRLKSDLPYLSR